MRLKQLVLVPCRSLPSRGLLGTLPASWIQLRSLAAIDLGLNALTGSLPDAWSQLEELQSLKLSQNDVHGLLPPSWSGLSKLKNLIVGSNALTGAATSQESALTLACTEAICTERACFVSVMNWKTLYDPLSAQEHCQRSAAAC